MPRKVRTKKPKSVVPTSQEQSYVPEEQWEAAVYPADGEEADIDTSWTIETILAQVEHDFQEARFWKPSKELANCLQIHYSQLTLAGNHNKETKRTVYIWSTVLVLCYCMTHLIEQVDVWQPLAEEARKWLFCQTMFVSNQGDLIPAACELIGANVRVMKKTIFAKTMTLEEDEEVLESEEAGDLMQQWETLHLDEPPYSVYYRHKRTYKVSWEHPHKIQRDEEAQAREREKLAREREILEAQEQRASEDQEEEFKAQERVSEDQEVEEVVIQQPQVKRVIDPSMYRFDYSKIRPVYNPPTSPACTGQSCAGKNPATICCVGCVYVSQDFTKSWNYNRTSVGSGKKMGRYYCNACCDEIHADPSLSNHVNQQQYHFVSCLGKAGFPRTQTSSITKTQS